MSMMVCLSRCWCARVNVYFCACPCKSKHVSECVSVTVCVSTCFCLYVHECVQVIVHLYERGFAGMTGRTCMLVCVYLCLKPSVKGTTVENKCVLQQDNVGSRLSNNDC